MEEYAHTLKRLIVSGTATPAERERARQAAARTAAPLSDYMFSRSEQEARAGAKIIVWSEGATGVFQEDEAALVTRGSALARTMGFYLDMGMGVTLLHPVQSRWSLDESILIDPKGRVVWRYEKTHLVPGMEANTVPGDGQVPTVQTPYGWHRYLSPVKQPTGEYIRKVKEQRGGCISSQQEEVEP